MRAGGCTVQQALTNEAASVVKQAVTLARRRGHAQVTPLHVANTMLSASGGLLRTACLQSRSHPLQCRALELCFNVALNRLPASTTSSPMLGSHHYSQHPQQYQHNPSISNALVAAFKRAQAHQRRGSIENQQQPLLAVKIELEQLIISILDDPSVSRVMREAGFSSTQVKSNVEQAVSLEICNNNSQTCSKSKEETKMLLQTTPSSERIRNEDVMCVIDNMVATNKRRRCTVVVGESVACVEGAVRGVMDKVDKGDVPEALRGVKFLNLSLFSFARLARDEVEHKLEELKSLIKSYVMASHGVVLFLGDLKWTAEYRSSSSSGTNNYYCPVEHVVMEIGKLVTKIGENERFWLMGIATFQTYMTCKSGHRSLENIWGLNPLTIPAGTLRLSLVADSDEQSQNSSKKGENGRGWLQVELGSRDGDDGDDDEDEEDYVNELSCCGDCSVKFESEARALRSNICNSASQDQPSSTLPAWLQHYKNQNKPTTNDQDCASVRDLCKKWNSICSSLHKQHYSSEKTLTFSSIISPSSTSTSNFSYHHDHQHPVLHRNKSWPQHSHFWMSSETTNNAEPNSTPNSTCSSDVMEVEYVQRFKELNVENLKTLCDALEKKMPSNKDIVPEIASTILQCRSGLVARKLQKHLIVATAPQKEETWLFFQGVDVAGKESIARELARLIFGSHSSFVSIALSSFASTRADSTDQDCRNKRSRDEQSCSYMERFAEAVSENPHRVFFVEDVDQADYCSQIGFKRAIERGTVTNSSGEQVGLGDAVVILSCESFSSRSRACSPSTKQRTTSDGSSDQQENHSKNGRALLSDQEKSPCVSLDLNMSIDDDSVGDDDQSIDDIGLLESVDKRIVFKFQDL